jgi:hypothetical protein
MKYNEFQERKREQDIAFLPSSLIQKASAM